MAPRRVLRLAASLLALSAAVYATPRPSAQLDPAQDSSLPSQDSFYNVPENLDKVQPGTILRHRTTPKPISVLGKFPVELKASHQILYRTTDNFGNATATALTVMIPNNTDTSKVLSFQVAEDAASIDCAPSYVFQQGHKRGPDFGTLFTELQLFHMTAAIHKGWIVISPDFLGPESAFLANKLAGHATLDGIRAALKSADFTGVSKSPTVAMWGYSSGSLASLWAAELQPEYAPELKIAGAAVGGLVPSIATTLATVNGAANAGLVAGGILGLTKVYSELRQIVDKHILPKYRKPFYKALKQCSLANGKELFGQDVMAMFDDRNLILTNPKITGILHENDIGKHTPRIPLFAYKAVADEVSPINETDKLINKYCTEGASIVYERYEASTHIDALLTAAPKVLAWLDDIMNHKNHQKGCKTSTMLLSQ
ncbi:secretory lipase domain-containing protein [Hirsutella rhossiliensis]